MSKISLPYLPSTLVWTKKKFGQVSPCLPYLPFQKVLTFWNKKLLVIITLFSYVYNKTILFPFFFIKMVNLKGRLQSKYKFVLKAAFLYVDIPAKTNFSEKFMF